MFFHLGYNTLWPDDLSLRAKTKNPGKELGAHNNVSPHGEVIRAICDDENFTAKAIKNGTNQVVLKTHLDIRFLAGEHTKGLPGIDCHVQRLISLLAIALLVQHGDFLHLINPVMFNHTGV